VLAVATLWLVEVGGWAAFEPRPETTVPKFRAAGSRRSHRRFRIGLGLIAAGLLGGEVRTGRFVPEPWPTPVAIPPSSEKEFTQMAYP
jgi:hypothetical protein